MSSPSESSSSSSFNSSFFFNELEKEMRMLSGENDVVTDRELYSGNRALIVLGDFFYDDLTARDYERGIIIKGRYDLLGKTIVLSRNRINHLLTSYCAISGLGVFRVSYSVSWTGQAELGHIDNLYEMRRRNNRQMLYLDIKLCRLLTSQPVWKYMIADLEKTEDENAILLG